MKTRKKRTHIINHPLIKKKPKTFFLCPSLFNLVMPNQWLAQLPLKNAWIVLFWVLVLASVSKWAHLDKPRYNRHLVRQVRRLMQQATQQQLQTGQDQNALVGLLNATKANTTLENLRAMFPDQTIRHITQLDVNELAFYASQNVEQRMQQVFQQCPVMKPDSVYPVHGLLL